MTEEPNLLLQVVVDAAQWKLRAVLSKYDVAWGCTEYYEVAKCKLAISCEVTQ